MTLQDELRTVHLSSVHDTTTPSEEVWRRLDRLRDLLSADIFLRSDKPQLVITTDTAKKPILLGKETIIGGSEDADIVLTCHFVSQRHCAIKHHNNCLEIQDLGSMNGTFVNGERVADMLLRDGDIIQVGTVTMVCLTGAPVFSDDRV